MGIGLPQASQAGTIYTTRAAYEAAVASMDSAWSEDFETFAYGLVPLPTPLGGGSAEIAKAGTARIQSNIVTLPPGGTHEWLGLDGGGR